MKQFYPIRIKGMFLSFLFSVILSFQSKATDLNAGELLFTGYHANAATTDAFSFVILVNLSGTTIISFTDNGWLSTNVFRAGEQTITWTYTGTLVAGREITISGPSAGAGTAIVYLGHAVIGSCSGSMPSFATSGDQIIAYRGTAGAPTLIAGLHMNVYSTDVGQCANTSSTSWDPTCITDNANFSTMPLGLAAGVSTTWIGTEGVGASEQDNAVFNCTGPLVTVPQIRAAVTNPANWTANSVAPPNFPLPSKCNFMGLLLPVTLLEFKATKQRDQILVNWQTTDEINHSYFEVEKSPDAINFISLARINPRGGASYVTDYEFRDNMPLPGDNYYRLKIVALNGSINYSAIAKVTFDGKGKVLFLSPNPAVTEVTVISSPAIYKEIIITNQLGSIVLRQKLTSNYQKTDVSKLPAGQYTITVAGASGKVSEKLMIIK